MVPAPVTGLDAGKKATVKFLIVDDKEENLTALEALLRRDNLEILKARSGDQALELLLQHDVALALLDVHMPDMDGFALAELMRGAQRSRRIPIIFVTAAPQEAHREFRGYDAGAVDFLFKPIDPRILRHKTDVFFELYLQRQQLEETLHLAETFMAIVGHDLKNPLNAINLGTELILANPSSPTVPKTAERLRSSARRMSRMIDDLFDLARARLGGGIPIERSETDLGAIARRVIGELDTAHPDRRVIFERDGDITGEWDPDRLAQVVSNLVGNAVRHGLATVADRGARSTGEGPNVVLTVANAGGIPADVIPHIFDPFRSSDTRRARAEGLGLGLFIVNQIVLAHGGAVAVDSTADRTDVPGDACRAPPPSRGGEQSASQKAVVAGREVPGPWQSAERRAHRAARRRRSAFRHATFASKKQPQGVGGSYPRIGAHLRVARDLHRARRDDVRLDDREQEILLERRLREALDEILSAGGHRNAAAHLREEVDGTPNLVVAIAHVGLVDRVQRRVRVKPAALSLRLEREASSGRRCCRRSRRR